MHTEQTKKKISENNAKYWLGKKRSPETIDKLRTSHLGIKYPSRTEAMRKAISDRMKIEWATGTRKKRDKLTEEHKKKIQQAHKNNPRSCLFKKGMTPWNLGRTDLIGKSGEDGNNWKGDDASYSAIHKWVNLKKGRPQKCEHCGTREKRRYEWANIDHRYRRVLEDYIRLCVSCHLKFDYKINGRKIRRQKIFVRNL